MQNILAPFFLAAIFAYLLNPAVNLLHRHFKFPRTLSISLIYIVIIGLIAILALNVGVQLANESKEFSFEANNLIKQTNSQISVLPNWLRPLALDTFESIRSSLLLPNHRIVSYLPGALNRTISILIFDKKKRPEIELIIQKINHVLGNYLRGQLFLILIMSALTYVGLLIIGVRYALIISIFTGFAEIVPFAGPIIAAAVAVIVAFTDQFSRINPTAPLLDVIAVVSMYTVLRQLEDLFIIPQVMGRVTKLHPLVILFSVLVGGQVFGIIGYIIAVPVIASAKVVFDHIKAP